MAYIKRGRVRGVNRHPGNYTMIGEADCGDGYSHGQSTSFYGLGAFKAPPEKKGKGNSRERMRLVRGKGGMRRAVPRPIYDPNLISPFSSRALLGDYYDGDGWYPGLGISIFKKIGKGIGKVAKGVGKGVAAVGKGVAKGAVAVGKTAVKVAPYAIAGGATLIAGKTLVPLAAKGIKALVTKKKAASIAPTEASPSAAAADLMIAPPAPEAEVLTPGTPSPTLTQKYPTPTTRTARTARTTARSGGFLDRLLGKKEESAATETPQPSPLAQAAGVAADILRSPVNAPAPAPASGEAAAPAGEEPEGAITEAGMLGNMPMPMVLGIGAAILFAMSQSKGGRRR